MPLDGAAPGRAGGTPARERQRPPRPRAADEPAAAQGLRRPRPGLHAVLARRRHGRRAPRRARRAFHGGREHRPPGLPDPHLRARVEGGARRPWCSRSGRSPTAATRIGSRRSAHGAGAFGPVHFGGHTYSLKVHEFRKVIELPRRSPQRFEIALDIHPGDERDREALEAQRLAPRRPARDRPRPARVPRLRAGIGRGVLRRAGHLRGDEQRLVQRPHRALPGVRPPRPRAGHRLQREPARRRGAAGLHRPRRGRGGGGTDRRGLRGTTAAPRAPSRRRTSTRTPCCPASSRKRGSALERRNRRPAAGPEELHADGARADSRVPARPDGRASWRSRSCRTRLLWEDETDPTVGPAAAGAGRRAGDGVRPHGGRVLPDRHPGRPRARVPRRGRGRST